MSPTIRHKCKYFHSAAQRAKDRRKKFHFCRLQLHVRPRNGKLNLSIAICRRLNYCVIFSIVLTSLGILTSFFVTYHLVMCKSFVR